MEQSKPDKWIESAYEAEGPLYWSTISILLNSHQKWQENKIAHLRRLIVLAQVRHCHPNGPNKVLADKNVKEYNVYKPYLIFFGLIDGVFKNFFKVCLFFLLTTTVHSFFCFRLLIVQKTYGQLTWPITFDITTKRY